MCMCMYLNCPHISLSISLFMYISLQPFTITYRTVTHVNKIPQNKKSQNWHHWNAKPQHQQQCSSLTVLLPPLLFSKWVSSLLISLFISLNYSVRSFVNGMITLLSNRVKRQLQVNSLKPGPCRIAGTLADGVRYWYRILNAIRHERC